MTYESVDQLQKALTENVFHYAKDSKKAAGRALGTIVEIITFYLLKTWKLNNSISIEKRIPEYGNPDITHNVEYSLHPILSECKIQIPNDRSSITANKMLKALDESMDLTSFKKTNNNLLKGGILRNACTIAVSNNSYLVASITRKTGEKIIVSIVEQSIKPFAIFECKRVGVEEGTKKGPQTIEKAKQGAYVARTVSSLQKVRLSSGGLYGIIYKGDKVLYSQPYHELLAKVVESDDAELLQHFILTVGVVSNHGNWFTSEDHNKELKVLAQSYDWLIFLTDSGIIEFVEDLIINPTTEYEDIKKAFLASYAPDKKKNQFTKVQMNINADEALLKYFTGNQGHIESWFNIISPSSGSIHQLKDVIKTLKSKHWEEIL